MRLMSQDDMDVVERLRQVDLSHGLCLHLYGPESGYWYADFHLPRSDESLIEGHTRASTRAEALRLAVERVEEVLGDDHLRKC